MTDLLLSLLAVVERTFERVVEVATSPVGFAVALLAAEVMLMVAYADHLANEHVE